MSWFRRERTAVSRAAGDFAWQRPAGAEDDLVRVACLVRPGLIVDELRMFEHAFELEHAHVEFTNVGAAPGRTPGVRGSVAVDCVFDEDPGVADIVLVPGAIGTAQAARDPQVMAWLVRSSRTARWMIASSTGSVVVAATGLLEGSEAATHWLAKGALETYHTTPAADRVAVHGNVITCSGESTIPVGVHLALHGAPREPVAHRPSVVADRMWRRPPSEPA